MISLLFLLASLLLLSGCATVPPAALGELQEDNNFATVCFVDEDDPRDRSIGNITLKNSSDYPVLLEDVQLEEAVNVTVSQAWFIPSNEGLDLGSGFPVPIQPDDPYFMEHADLWSLRSDAFDTPIAANTSQTLVVVLNHLNRREKGSFESIMINYKVGNSKYSFRWSTSYRLLPSGSVELCE